MPQMAPINWTLLYLNFILLFIFIIIISFYLYFYYPKMKKLTKMNKNFSWKW